MIRTSTVMNSAGPAHAAASDVSCGSDFSGIGLIPINDPCSGTGIKSAHVTSQKTHRRRRNLHRNGRKRGGHCPDPLFLRLLDNVLTFGLALLPFALAKGP